MPKHGAGVFLAGIAFHSLGSEKLTEFIDELIQQGGHSPLEQIFAVFILLELDPARAIRRISIMSQHEEFEKWMLASVTQRLYQFYTTRPLPDGLKRSFEDLVADLELKVSGQSHRRDAKSVVLRDIKRQAYSGDE